MKTYLVCLLFGVFSRFDVVLVVTYQFLYTDNI